MLLNTSKSGEPRSKYCDSRDKLSGILPLRGMLYWMARLPGVITWNTAGTASSHFKQFSIPEQTDGNSKTTCYLETSLSSCSGILPACGSDVWHSCRFALRV